MALATGQIDLKNINETINVVLSKDSVIFAGSNSTALAGATDIIVSAFIGKNSVPFTIGTITGTPSGMNKTVTNVAGTNNQKVNIAVTTAMITPSGVIVIPVTVAGATVNKEVSFAIAFSGQAGRSITAVDVEFSKNQSTSVAPATGWDTNAPAWQQGYYIWSRTVTTYSTGSPTISTPVCITGGQGQTGGTGKGIASIKEQYYLSTSNSSATGGSWLDYMPAWENGKYIWTRFQTTWTDTTVTDSTPVIADGINSANQRAFDAEKETQKIAPFIVGTQTATTANWTGNAPFSSLQHGQQITYLLTQTSASNVTLDLTLPNMTTTGPINCYYSGSSRLTTHYAQGNIIRLTYLVDNKVGASFYTGWWADANYADGNNYDRISYARSIYAKSAITAGYLIVSDETDKFYHLAKDVPFTIDKPMLYAGSAIAINAAGSNNYTVYPSGISIRSNSPNKSLSLVSQKIVYIKGTLNGLTYTPTDANLFVTDPVDDGSIYMMIGQLYSTYQISFHSNHDLYMFDNGIFKSFAQIAAEANQKANQAIQTADIEYYASTSPTSLAGGSWSTTAPPLTSAQYLWSRTKVTYVSGTVEYRPSATGTNISGAMGVDGRSVTSIVEEYYLSTSSSSQTGGSWGTSVPAWEDGKYLWTRTTISFSSGSPTTTNPMCVTGGKGQSGTNAKLISLTGSGQTFIKNTSGAISPATITVTADVQNTSVTAWSYSVDGGTFSTTAPTGVSRTGSTVTITGSTMTAKSIVVKASDGTYSDVYTVSKIEDGGNALSPVISNSSHTVPASSAGSVSSYSGSGTTIQVFEGATPLTFHTTIANGRFTIGTPTISPASKITVGAISGSGTTTATVAAHSAMDGTTDSVVITYPITAKRADGTQTTFSVTQTITKSKTGEKGDNGANGSNGADGYTVILTSESHTFAGSTTAALAGTATSNVIVYKGATQIASSITSITGLVTGLTAPITGNGTTSNYFTATATTALVARNGELTVNISADGKTFVKKFTFTVTRDGTNGSNGSNGSNAKLVDIVPSALYFVTNTVGTDPSTYVYAPSSIALTPTFQSCTYSKWEYSVNGSTWTTITTQNGLSINSTSKVLTVSSASTLFNSTQTFLIFKCSSTTGEADVVTLNRIFESGALGGRLSTAESLITQNANQIALRVTETQVTDKINAIEIGGRNLLKKSDILVTNSTYPTQRYDMTQKMSASKTYTIRLWGSLGAGKTGFSAYLNGGSIALGGLTNNNDGTFSLTFVGKDSGVTTGDFINIYPMPSGTVVDSTIEKIKLEVGTKATDYTNAPEDDQQYINDVVSQMAQELNSTVEQTATSLRTEISEQYYTKGTTDQLVSAVGTELEQTKTAFDFQFVQITKNVNDIQKGNDAEFTDIRKHIRFESGDIILGESTNNVTLKIENNRIGMYVGGVEVSYWEVGESENDSPKFYATDGEFLKSLRLGNFAWTPRDNGNLSFGKVI